MMIHKVKAGQTLELLSRLYSADDKSIAAANMLPAPFRLVDGEALVIPTEDFLYAVRPGDTPQNIADRFGTTVPLLIRQNGLAGQRLFAGQELRIPAQQYLVKNGDTLDGIARAFGVSPEDLMRANGLTSPGQIRPRSALTIPLRREKTEIEVNAYVYHLGRAGALCVAAEGESLTYIAPFAYMIRQDGSLQPIDDSPIVSAAYAENAAPMMTIANFSPGSPGSELAHAVLSNQNAVSRLLDNIVAVMQEKNYRALKIDFENVFPEDRALFNQFAQKAAERMHAQGFAISSALAPKYGAEQEGLLYTAHDYPVHGKVMDFVVLMTYEWGYREGPAQAISPVNQIRRVLDYAVTVIPQEKILLGFLIYARDWLLPFRPGQVAETFSVAEARMRAARYGATILYDEAAQSPFYNYIDEQGRIHEVWFEDARSAQAKFDLVKEYNLRGLSYWALCYPFPQNWALLNDNFTIKKLM